ncbi:glutathione S-transferase [Monoraphidium neglectum]|uniref:Glutathione S-transferase n=1 Tax=Monoraphidium neglectum TaxID=145388 RepID=A0A0D2NU17_9CHLO|nr:glutathione S-transferase [Monoraphidium neglectum]KIZ07611.1 glutathione S-transferase [Monoraphidium neglectum]|eukprot:XP_013906630.1 glutathione S-transferase [Monoraphidium neglectum]
MTSVESLSIDEEGECLCLPNAHKSSSKPLVFFRDTNGWCPYCARVWLALEEKGIEYDSVLIDLYAKPDWYSSMVPTNLVPAVNLLPAKASGDWGAPNGNGGGHQDAEPLVVWESKDILLALEERFPDAPSLLPADEADRKELMSFLDELGEAGVERAGFSFMTGGRLLGDSQATANHGAELVESLRVTFLEKLSWLEAKFAARGGPYLMGSQFTIGDIMCISFMERLAAGLPKFRGLQLRNHPDFPAVAQWLAAMEARPTYQRVRSDDQTLQLLFARMMRGSTAAADSAALAWQQEQRQGGGALAEARAEAAAALEAGRKDLVKALILGSGICRYQANPYGATLLSVNGHRPTMAPAVMAAITLQLDRIIATLKTGVPGPRADGTSACAMGAAAAAYLRARHRDIVQLSPAAQAQLELACSRVLTQTFADHVDPMHFEPMVAPTFSDPAAGAADADAAAEGAARPASPPAAAGGGGPGIFSDADPFAVEAALKIQVNREAILEDIATKSGIARPTASAFGRTFVSFNGGSPRLNAAVKEAIDLHLRRLAGLLLTGNAGPKADDPEAAAIGAASLAFFRNRASAPRDMSATAAERFRAACDKVLLDIY